MAVSKITKLQRLLDDSPEKWYWLGFLLADGSFNKNGRLSLCLGIKDLEHLTAFRDFVGCGNIRIAKGGKSCEWKVMDTSVMKKLTSEFKISSRKTYQPPDLHSVNETSLKLMSIGFIDGDGSIKKQFNRNSSSITIKVHSSWKNVLVLLFPQATHAINQQGYARSFITKNDDVRHLKLFALQYNLPILKRKWDVIDDSYIGKYDVALHNKHLIGLYRTAGFRDSEIAAILRLSHAAVSSAETFSGTLEGLLENYNNCIMEVYHRNCISDK